MCIILQKKPGFTIPYEKFSAAVENNPDGWGLSVPNRDGGLLTLRSGETPKTDDLYRLLHEEYGDTNSLLHLRYTTAGETNLRNAHPFPILEKRKDGVDLRMAHNGTLPEWVKAKSDHSDTRLFVREFVRPLFKRLIRGIDSQALLKDQFVIRLLDDQLTAASVLSFIDGYGNVLHVNGEGNGGKEEDGWYYSNVYSFDPDHRLPYTGGTYYLNGVKQGGTSYQKKTQGAKATGIGAQSVGTQASSTKTTTLGKDSMQKDFTGITQQPVTSVFNLSNAQLKEMVTHQPSLTTLWMAQMMKEYIELKEENELLIEHWQESTSDDQ